MTAYALLKFEVCRRSSQNPQSGFSDKKGDFEKWN